MAQRIVTNLVDDLDGSSPADETIRFSVDGSEYEIDLSARHAAEFRSVLNVYVGAARKIRGRRMKLG
jgi:hypothetical protein